MTSSIIIMKHHHTPSSIIPDKKLQKKTPDHPVVIVTATTTRTKKVGLKLLDYLHLRRKQQHQQDIITSKQMKSFFYGDSSTHNCGDIITMSGGCESSSTACCTTTIGTTNTIDNFTASNHSFSTNDCPTVQHSNTYVSSSGSGSNDDHQSGSGSGGKDRWSNGIIVHEKLQMMKKAFDTETISSSGNDSSSSISDVEEQDKAKMNRSSSSSNIMIEPVFDHWCVDDLLRDHYDHHHLTTTTAENDNDHDHDTTLFDEIDQVVGTMVHVDLQQQRDTTTSTTPYDRYNDDSCLFECKKKIVENAIFKLQSIASKFDTSIIPPSMTTTTPSSSSSSSLVVQQKETTGVVTAVTPTPRNDDSFRQRMGIDSDHHQSSRRHFSTEKIESSLFTSTTTRTRNDDDCIPFSRSIPTKSTSSRSYDLIHNNNRTTTTIPKTTDVVQHFSGTLSLDATRHARRLSNSDQKNMDVMMTSLQKQQDITAVVLDPMIFTTSSRNQALCFQTFCEEKLEEENPIDQHEEEDPAFEDEAEMIENAQHVPLPATIVVPTTFVRRRRGPSSSRRQRERKSHYEDTTEERMMRQQRSMMMFHHNYRLEEVLEDEEQEEEENNSNDHDEVVAHAQQQHHHHHHQRHEQHPDLENIDAVQEMGGYYMDMFPMMSSMDYYYDAYLQGCTSPCLENLSHASSSQEHPYYPHQHPHQHHQMHHYGPPPPPPVPISPNNNNNNTTTSNGLIELHPGLYGQLNACPQEAACAIVNGRIQYVTCPICTTNLLCLDYAEYVLCPTCHSLSNTPNQGAIIIAAMATATANKNKKNAGIHTDDTDGPDHPMANSSNHNSTSSSSIPIVNLGLRAETFTC